MILYENKLNVDELDHNVPVTLDRNSNAIGLFDRIVIWNRKLLKSVMINLFVVMGLLVWSVLVFVLYPVLKLRSIMLSGHSK